MPTMRKRKDFDAQIQSVQGTPVSDCHVYLEIETTIAGDQRDVRWAGKFTSLTDPTHAFRGSYLLQPRGATGTAKISVHGGAEDRMGITSDEYQFRGEGAPPELP
jgi:hypothetical protein